MEINFKKFVTFFLAIFSVHYVQNNVVCQLTKEECEKDVPHIVENIGAEWYSHFTNVAVFVSGSSASTMSFRTY
ncbi:MAG: hypothetical protein PHY72_03575 [Candidatus Pacebacteria bacterium]|nr:hypothetical protein [Candidatus Paceibacterota bacterium]